MNTIPILEAHLVSHQGTPAKSFHDGLQRTPGLILRSRNLLVVLFLFLLSNTNAGAVQVGSIFYNTQFGSAWVSGVDFSVSGSFTIPSEINFFDPSLGVSRTLIVDRILSLQGYTNITEISIPNTVTRIESYAFKGCTNLTRISIPDSVFQMGEEVFMGCTSLTEVSIGNGVTVIPNNTFRGCTSLDQVALSENITSIGESAFYGCASLSSLEIPASVTRIRRYTFKDCTSLANITIPGSVTRIEIYAFSNCSSLTTIAIPTSVTEIEEGSFEYCTLLTVVAIPNGVTSIGGYAFRRCDNLEGIALPAGLTWIGDGAFYECGKLASITIPGGVTHIRPWAFAECPDLSMCLFHGSAPPFFGSYGWNNTSFNVASVFQNASPSFNIYYRPGSKGFTTPAWNGYPCRPLNSRSSVATVTILLGNVSVVRDGFSMPLKLAEPIYLDDIIITRTQSAAKIVFLDESSMNVAPSSNLTIKYDIESSKPSIHLNRGKLRIHKSPGDKLRAWTRRTVGGIRGTTVTVEAIEENGVLTTITAVLEGVIDHEDLVTGVISEIQAGESISIQSAVETHTLTIHHAPALGTLSVNGIAISSFPHVANYGEGTEINLQATPGTGLVFSGWSGDFVSSYPACTFFLDGDMTVTSNFLALTDYAGTHPALNPNGDNNGNGRSNFLDYASGQDPESSGTLPIVDLREGLLTLRQRINGVDAIPVPEYSDNLSDWFALEEGAHYTVLSSTVNGEMLTQVVELVTDSAPKRFFRQGFD